MLFANYYHPNRIANASFAEVDIHHTHNPTHTNRALREAFFKRGIELNNPDVNVGRKIEFSLFHDGQPIPNITGPKYLIATENPYICGLNCDESYLRNFNHVFTWNKNLMHLENVSQVFIPNQIEVSSFRTFSERSIFSTLINANKGFSFVLETDLYKERLHTIQWYEKNAPNYFSLYGLGWDKPPPAYTLKNKFVRRLKRLGSQLFGYKPFPLYKGDIPLKSSVYQNAKFAYCYENVSDLPDYLSEKIFDAMLSGCIPIYWGTNTITELIPANCFIDRRKFESTAAVHQYLLGVTESQYLAYQNNILNFLLSPNAKKFDINSYVEIIVNHILKFEKNA
jgi:hypothetical protein